MKIAVIQFPGSNCDIDLYSALHDVCNADVEYVSHKATSLDGFDAVMLPGAFPMATICGPARLLGSPTLCPLSSSSLMKASRFLVPAMASRF